MAHISIKDDIPDLFISRDEIISIDGNEVKAGQELLYKVTYKNTTGKDQKVVIKDKIPEHTTYVKGSASNKGVYKDGEITWTKEKVADGEIFEVTFKVKVNVTCRKKPSDCSCWCRSKIWNRSIGYQG